MERFDDLVFHPNFEDHQSQAGRAIVSEEEVWDVWLGDHAVVRNRKHRRGAYLMVGLTDTGRPVTVVLRRWRPTGTWQAYTAWDTKASDR